MLGHQLVRVLGERFEVWATVRRPSDAYRRFGLFDPARTVEGLDVRDFGAVRETVSLVRPDVVINAVGIIKQLPDARNHIESITINALLPHVVAEAAERVGSRTVSIGTDCVFDGARGAYRETDRPDADDLYGRTKLLGEVTAGNALTLRTSIIGRELFGAHSLVEWFLSNEGGRVRGFRRAIYSGFPTAVLAGIIADLIETRPDLRGLYHVASEPIDKFTLLGLVRDAYGARIEIEPDDGFVIDRSLDACRFAAETGFVPEPWPAMIGRMAADPTPYGAPGNRK